MDGVVFAQMDCPYCGEPIELSVDPSAGSQAYIEDCAVCCRPIEVRLTVCGAEWTVEARREDD